MPRLISNGRGPALLVLALALLAGCKKNTKKDTGDGTNHPPANPNNPFIPGSGGDPKAWTGSSIPEGWAEARDPVAGYRLLMPGPTKFHSSYKGSTAMEKLQATSCSHGVKGLDTDVRVRSISFVPPAGFKAGTSPDELFAALKLARTGFETFHTVLEKSPTTLGGKPAVKIVTKPVDLAAGAKLPDDPEFAKDILDRRKKMEAERTTYYVTIGGQRVVFLEISSPGNPPPALLKTVTDSFAFQ